MVNEETPGEIRIDLTNTGGTEATATSFIRKPFEGGPFFDFLEPGATAGRVYVVGDEKYDIRITVNGCDGKLRFKGRRVTPE